MQLMKDTKMKNVPLEYEKMFEKAIGFRNKGMIDGSIKILLKLINNYKEYQYAYIILGDIYWDKNELLKSIKLFKKAIEISPSSEKASLCLFHVLWEKGDREEALDEMKRYLKNYTSEEYSKILKEINDKTNE